MSQNKTIDRIWWWTLAAQWTAIYLAFWAGLNYYYPLVVGLVYVALAFTALELALMIIGSTIDLVRRR